MAERVPANDNKREKKGGMLTLMGNGGVVSLMLYLTVMAQRGGPQAAFAARKLADIWRNLGRLLEEISY